ncbi:MAG TPA: TRAFs-binding domain-containing protein [Terriglobales bacterium]|nr:TRAFs-binding domain-containing protein [Terriglobales bacterium]
MDYKPGPIDTLRLALTPEIAQLSEMLAKNVHENWAKLRIAEGWHYGPHRDDLQKEHPNLVPYEQLPESERQYDSQTAMESIKALLAMGYTIQPPAGTRISSEGTSPASGSGLTSVLQMLRDRSQPDLALLQGFWRAHDPEVWSVNPEPYRLLGERILKLGEPLVAYDVVAEGMKSFPQDLRLRQLLALALARSGAAGPANNVLALLYQDGYRDEETLGLLARTHKDLAREEGDAFKSSQHLRRAYEFYSEGYETSGGYWSAINAATLALFLGERESAAALARLVSDQCRQRLRELTETNGERYWLVSTLGEAALLLEDWSEAENWYCQAVELGRGDWGSLQSTRHNARLLMQCLAPGEDGGRIEQLFRFPSVVVFAGHMVDRDDRTVPRFPPRLEPMVKDAIRQRLSKLNAGFGYASGACGSDILFHEVILEMKGESYVILPCEKERFIKDSVETVEGSDWGKRLEKVIAQAIETQEVSRQRQGSNVSYEFANLMLHGLASVRAEQLETKLVPVAVWDGKSGTGLGGTAGTVERWRRLGLPVEIIDLEEILRCECPGLSVRAAASPAPVSKQASAASSEFAPEIRALLFADAEGFSKLTDEEVPLFAQHFLGLAGRLAAESAHRPLTKNTWGDGLYFVFSNVRDAGRFALDLRDAVRNTDWPKHGLPPLNLRIGLHAGPVYSCCDPVTQRTTYIGANVSRAARIEPITPTGQVYASQTFAALAAAEGVKEFRCDYVGQTSMAKKYGTFPTYVVLRRKTATQPS